MTQMGALTAHREHFGDRERRVIAQDILYEAVWRVEAIVSPYPPSAQFSLGGTPHPCGPRGSMHADDIAWL